MPLATPFFLLPEAGAPLVSLPNRWTLPVPWLKGN